MGIPGWVKRLPFMPLFLILVFIVSGLLVSLLMFLGMVMWPINKTLYRRYANVLSYALWSQFTFLAQWWCESDFTLYMDPEDFKYLGKEHTLTLINHTYELDWMMAWTMAERREMLANSKMYFKGILKFVPILGWTWYFTESIFLERNWEKDKVILEKSIKEVITYPNNFPVTLLLCAEGTRWTPEKHAVCLKLAEEKGYPKYRHVLIPRTKGFFLSMQLLKGKIPSILDITIGFPDPQPTFMDALTGKKMKCALKLKRYLLDDVPSETEEECGDWLRQLYKLKDDNLEEYRKTGKFSGAPVMEVPRRKYDLYCYIFWTIFTGVPLIYYAFFVIFYASVVHKIIAVAVIAVLIMMVQRMIQFTQIKHATSYGLEAKQKEAEKKSN